METTTTSPAVSPADRKYSPSAPHYHYLQACNAVDALWESVPFEHRTEIIRLIGKATMEAFIRGMDPDRPMA